MNTELGIVSLTINAQRRPLLTAIKRLDKREVARVGDIAQARMDLQLIWQTNHWLTKRDQTLVGWYVVDPASGNTRHAWPLFDRLQVAGQKVLARPEWLHDGKATEVQANRHSGWGVIETVADALAQNFIVRHCDGSRAIYAHNELYTESGWFGNLAVRWWPLLNDFELNDYERVG